MNVLVTGGCGFIGSNFIKYIINEHKDWNIINLDALTYAGNLENLSDIAGHERYVFCKGDITDKTLVDELFDKYDFDYVVNFAAESHVDRSILHPDLFCKTNVMGTLNLINSAKSHWKTDNGFKKNAKYLQVSTDEVYGALGSVGFFTETTPINPHSPYSSSKASADLFVKAYFDTYSFPCVITRCSNNYGAYQFPEKLIPLVFNNACNNKPIPVYGDGMQIRDWLYVIDHCKAIDKVLLNGQVGQVYNVGGHNEKTNIDIIHIIINYVHDNINANANENLITFVSDRLGHDRRYAIDPDKIHQELDWLPETPFEKGIILTLNWYKDNQKWLDGVTSGNYVNYYKKMYGEI